MTCRQARERKGVKDMPLIPDAATSAMLPVSTYEPGEMVIAAGATNARSTIKLQIVGAIAQANETIAVRSSEAMRRYALRTDRLVRRRPGDRRRCRPRKLRARTVLRLGRRQASPAATGPLARPSLSPSSLGRWTRRLAPGPPAACSRRDPLNRLPSEAAAYGFLTVTLR